MAQDFRLPQQVRDLAKGRKSPIADSAAVPESVVKQMRLYHLGNPSPTDNEEWLGWGGAAGRSWARRMVKMGKRTLYVSRALVNAEDFIDHFKAQGFTTVIPSGELHVTIAFSKTSIDWDTLTESFDEIRIPEQTDRIVKPLGDGGAVVLRFDSKELASRWQAFKDLGASWDWDGYQPHVTITFKAPEGLDLSKVEPYTGELVFGPEVWAEIKEDWKDSITEKRDMAKFATSASLLKVDESLGLVFGWAVICLEDDQPYFDTQGHHIPERVLVKSAADFMLNSRIGGDMHGRTEDDEVVVKGTVVFCFPMTSDIAKSLGITTKTTGLIIAMKPDDPAVLTKYRNGEYTGFSIGGSYDTTTVTEVE